MPGSAVFDRLNLNDLLEIEVKSLTRDASRTLPAAGRQRAAATTPGKSARR